MKTRTIGSFVVAAFFGVSAVGSEDARADLVLKLYRNVVTFGEPVILETFLRNPGSEPIDIRSLTSPSFKVRGQRSRGLIHASALLGQLGCCPPSEVGTLLVHGDDLWGVDVVALGGGYCNGNPGFWFGHPDRELREREASYPFLEPGEYEISAAISYSRSRQEDGKPVFERHVGFRSNVVKLRVMPALPSELSRQDAMIALASFLEEPRKDDPKLLERASTLLRELEGTAYAPHLRWALGLAYVVNGRHAEAVPLLSALAEKDESYVTFRALCGLTTAYASIGERGKAMQAAERLEKEYGHLGRAKIEAPTSGFLGHAMHVMYDEAMGVRDRLRSEGSAAVP